MNTLDKLNLKKLINETECENNTENIRKLKHSSLIREDIVKMQNQELVGLCPWTATIPRLCRSNPDEYMIPSQSLMMNLLTAKYVDFHMPEYHTYESIIYRTLESTGKLDNINLK